MSILIGVLTFLLILVSAFLILVVLAQKAKSDGGVGAAMGGAMVESAFGAEGGNVLSKSTINAAIAFFVLSLALYLVHLRRGVVNVGGELPNIAPASAGPTAGTPAAVTPLAVPLAVPPATPAAATPAPEPAKQPAP